MRCAKCGYVSFDYLSECKKCRANLAGTREVLGFLAAKPAVPSLLGPLFRDYEPPARQESGAMQSDISTALGLGDKADGAVQSEISTALDLGDKAGGGFWRAEHGSGAPEITSAIAHPDEAGEDFSLLDLSDEELELLIDEEPFATGTEQAGMQGSSSDGSGGSVPGPFSPAEPAPPAFQTGPGEDKTPSAAGTAQDELLSDPDHDLPLLEDKRQAAPTGEPIPKLTGDLPGLKEEGPKSAPAEFRAPPEQAAPKPEESTDDFVIELSENDLDILLRELGSSLKGEAEQESKGQIKRPETRRD
ncbi:MAG: hypothetical protein ABSG91_06670 [Syntrophobacteraceae bacterium]|jgi:hypothetical protein